MPGARNPISMSGFINKVGEAVKNAKATAHDRAEVAKSKAEEKYMNVKYVDLEIQVRRHSSLFVKFLSNRHNSSLEHRASQRWMSWAQPTHTLLPNLITGYHSCSSPNHPSKSVTPTTL
jgi:competence transcription factor ComK